jgi:hypothetical protein
MHTTHNTSNCNQYNSNGTHKKSSGTARPHQKDHNPQGANFAQVVHAKRKKSFRTVFKKAAWGKKCCNHCDERDSDSDFDFWSGGSDSTWELHVVRKLK